MTSPSVIVLHFREVRRCEKPLYTIIRPLGSQRNWWDGKSPAELRQYAPMLIAEVAGKCKAMLK